MIDKTFNDWIWSVPLVTSLTLGFLLGVGKKRKNIHLPWTYKLVLVVPRQSIRLAGGHLAEHCSSASILAFETSRTKAPMAHHCWIWTGQRKVVLRTDSTDDLNRFAEQASQMKICSSMVRKRQNQPIVLAIGPGPSSLVDRITGHLKLL